MVLRASLLVVPCLLALGCRPKPPAAASPAELQALVEASNSLAWDAYRDQAKAPGSFVFAPLGAMQPAALLAWGAGERPERAPAFGLPPERIPMALETLRRDFLPPPPAAAPRSGDEGPRLEFGMSVWVDAANGMPWSSRRVLPVLMLAEPRTFGAGARRRAAEADLRAWVASRTGGAEPSSSLTLPPPEGLLVVGTTRFAVRWEWEFNPDATIEQPFHALDGTVVPVPMMHHHEPWPYCRDGDCEATRLPYDGTPLEMVLLLPAAGHLREVETSLEEGRLTRILAQLANPSPDGMKAELFLPRFTIDRELDLGAVLGRRGLQSILAGRTPLPRLQNRDPGLPLAVKQATHFEVDEGGTRGVTLTYAVTLGVAKTRPLRFDRPFLFLVRDPRTGAILYLGRFVGPTRG